jgi:hypothetical protein
MNRVLIASLFPLSALLLMAADSSWKSKQTEQWTEEDAKQVLVKSPWVQKATPRMLPKTNEAARRDGGKMGGSQGVGVQAISPATLFGGGPPRTHAARPNLLMPLEIRWESAGPVRVAETKSHEEDAPDLEGGLYAIAVYDVPGLDIDQKGLAADLTRESSLSRDGKKDLKPSKVDLLPQANGLTTVVFLFPQSDAITLEDKRIKFTAVFDHLAVAQYFYTKDMLFQGKLDL